jgi:FdhD protein
VVDVLLRGDTRDVWKNLSRNIFSASSCGICGKATIEAVMSHTPALPVSPGVSLSPGVLGDLAARLRGGQEVFATTGGLHAAALFRMDGTLLCLREDVGRHNAVDKVLGASLLAGSLPLSAHILMVSGRVSFEVVQKALAAGVRVVAAISAPSSLAVDFAVRSGQTLIGFLRDGRFNVYANPGLLLSGSGQGFEG